MNLNLKQGFGEPDIGPFLGGKRRADVPHLLWVSKKGDVWLDAIPESLTPERYIEMRKDDIQFRFEVFKPGDNFVGETAGEDFVLAVRLHHALKSHWTSAFKGVVEVF